MKDKNGIEIECQNCRHYEYCKDNFFPDVTGGSEGCSYFEPSAESYEARIAELQKELNIVQMSERAEAQEADRLREEVKELKKENERLSKEIIDLGTGTLAEKNYQLAMRAASALCIAAKKLNYDTSKLSTYDLIEVFLKEGEEKKDKNGIEIKCPKQIQKSSESFYQKYSGVSEEYALGALEQCAIEADELQAKIEELENKLTETIKLLSKRSRECGKLEAYNEVLQRRIKEAESEDNYENYDIERDYD